MVDIEEEVFQSAKTKIAGYATFALLPNDKIDPIWNEIKVAHNLTIDE